MAIESRRKGPLLLHPRRVPPTPIDRRPRARGELKQGTFDDFASKELRMRVYELLDSSQDAQLNRNPTAAALYSNFKEHELRKAIASLSQTASEAQSELARSAVAKRASICPFDRH